MNAAGDAAPAGSIEETPALVAEIEPDHKAAPILLQVFLAYHCAALQPARPIFPQ